MAVTLTKGQRVSLDKVAPGLTEVFVGLGWDVKAMDTGFDFDLDASAFLLVCRNSRRNTAQSSIRKT